MDEVYIYLLLYYSVLPGDSRGSTCRAAGGSVSNGSSYGRYCETKNSSHGCWQVSVHIHHFQFSEKCGLLPQGILLYILLCG
jgi:hypothetical protein